MTKSQRKLFVERVEKVFEMMSFMPPPLDEWSDRVTSVENIKQLDSEHILHRLMFINNDWSPRMTLRHDVWEIKNNIERHLLEEYYRFHPGGENSLFELLSSCSGFTYIKLFERRSKIDMDDLLIKLKLKVVEMI